MDNVAIKVEHVGKDFRLPHDKSSSIKNSLINGLRRRGGYEIQHALHDISFEVKRGEFFGIVGKNGGGKSTLLKIISGIYTPSKGSVNINGKLTPFIELGVGFNPELTGRENVFLNGSLLGFSRNEMAVMYSDIVKFAELEDFMDQKLKNYSSGMQVRLAFSIAIRAQSDILVMDEVLAVGDAAFQKKCFDVFRELKRQNRTIILVTHDMGNVERFCDRVLVIDRGKQLALTDPAEAASIYARLNIDGAQIKINDQKRQLHGARYGSGEVKVKRVRTVLQGEEADVFSVGDEFSFEVELEYEKGCDNTLVACGLAFFNEDNINVFGPNNEENMVEARSRKITYTLPKLPLTPGEYAVTVAIYNKDKTDIYFDLLEKWTHFSVIADHVTHGVVELDGVWTT